MATPELPVDLQTLTAALREHYRSRHPSPDDEEGALLLALALDLEGLATPSDRPVARDSLASSAELRRVVETARGFPIPVRVGPVRAAEPGFWTREFWTQWFWLPLIPVAALSLFLALRGPSGEPIVEVPPPDGLTPRGSDDIVVGIRRGAHDFLLRPGEKVESGDRLGLFYSSQKSGHLAVLHADQAGTVTWVYPATVANSGAIQAGERIRLEAGGTLSRGTHCEWVVGVFSDEPLDRKALGATLAEQARATPRENPRCMFEPTAPESRRLSVVPIRW